MTLQTFRFGDVLYEPENKMTFPEGIPGLEDLREFIFVHTEETEPIFYLQSLEDTTIALPVVRIFDLVEDYAFDISDHDQALLKITRAEDVLVLVVVVIPEQVEKMTANLAAPIAIELSHGLGKQVFSHGSAYHVRHPIFDAMMQFIKGRDAHVGSD